MGEEVLSQAEVESLLSAIETGGKRADSPASRSTAADSGRLAVKVEPYDFKRPERVGKDQMRALQSLHEGFSRNFGAALSGLLRSIVEVKLISVDQLTYSEFVFSLSNPTCFNLIRAEPLEGHFILDISPAILYPIIDRLLGGGKESSPPARRPLTEIELRLVARLTRLFLDDLQRGWENVLPLELSVQQVESNPHLIQIVPPNEVVVLIGFELAMGDVRGMLNLCIPFNAIERIGNKLAANSWVSYSRAGASPESIAQIGRRLDGSLLELVVTLAHTRITTADLLGLRVGDIITTDRDIRSRLEVAVEGVPKFHATPGAWKGRKAIQIQDPLATEEKKTTSQQPET